MKLEPGFVIAAPAARHPYYELCEFCDHDHATWHDCSTTTYFTIINTGMAAVIFANILIVVELVDVVSFFKAQIIKVKRFIIVLSRMSDFERALAAAAKSSHSRNMKSQIRDEARDSLHFQPHHLVTPCCSRTNPENWQSSRKMPRRMWLERSSCIICRRLVDIWNVFLSVCRGMFIFPQECSQTMAVRVDISSYYDDLCLLYSLVVLS